jgi:hypothetical protein
MIYVLTEKVRRWEKLQLYDVFTEKERRYSR